MKFFEVFRAGKYPQGEFTEADVKAIAANYDPKFCEAPITIDHSGKGPAFGWVEAVKAEGVKLMVAFRDVAEGLKESVDAGAYKKVSVEFFRNVEGRKPYLKAVSFLGAATPQVKGLEPITFKDGETDVIEFEVPLDADPGQPATAEPAPGAPPADPADPAAPTADAVEVARLSAQVTDLEGRVATFAQVDADRQKAEEELGRLRIQMQRMFFEQFLNEQIAYGNVVPAQKDICMKLLEALGNVAAFADGGEQPVDVFKTLLKGLPKQVEFGEVARRDAAGAAPDLSDPRAIADKAVEFKDAEEKAGRVISFTAAVTHVMKVNP